MLYLYCTKFVSLHAGFLFEIVELVGFKRPSLLKLSTNPFLNFDPFTVVKKKGLGPNKMVNLKIQLCGAKVSIMQSYVLIYERKYQFLSFETKPVQNFFSSIKQKLYI